MTAWQERVRARTQAVAQQGGLCYVCEYPIQPFGPTALQIGPAIHAGHQWCVATFHGLSGNYPRLDETTRLTLARASQRPQWAQHLDDWARWKRRNP